MELLRFRGYLKSLFLEEGESPFYRDVVAEYEVAENCAGTSSSSRLAVHVRFVSENVEFSDGCSYVLYLEIVEFGGGCTDVLYLKIAELHESFKVCAFCTTEP